MIHLRLIPVSLVASFSLLASSFYARGQNPEVAREASPAITKAAGLQRPPGTVTNSLGMIFVPVGDVLVSIWETRVRDFEAFADVAGYDATEGAQINGVPRHEARRYNWRHPGFPQTPDHAVCLVSWEDADAFCRWLTQFEREDGTLEAARHYRLPTEAEWNEALGVVTRFPWGDDWPPPAKFGNYGGQEARVQNWPRDWKGLPDYQDGFPRTSPVGSFAPNERGIFDLSGNVWEFCLDWHRPNTNAANFAQQNGHAKPGQGHQTYRRVRGGGWVSYTERMLMSDMRRNEMPYLRYDTTGFRCVIAADDGAPRERRLKIRVTAEPTDRWLTNAPVEVAVTLNGRGRSRWALRTDAEGRCSVGLPVDAPGTIAFTVAIDGFVPRETVLPESEALPSEHKVTLTRGTAIGGVVRDDDGKPVADARVDLIGPVQVQTSNWIPDYAVNARTDAGGRWISHRLPADWTRLRIAVNKEGYNQSAYAIQSEGATSIIRAALLATNAVFTLRH